MEQIIYDWIAKTRSVTQWLFPLLPLITVWLAGQKEEGGFDIKRALPYAVIYAGSIILAMLAEQQK